MIIHIHHEHREYRPDTPVLQRLAAFTHSLDTVSFRPATTAP